MGADPAPASAQTKANSNVEELRALLASQQKQIEELRSALEEQKKAVEKLTAAQNADSRFALPNAQKLGEVATTSPVLPPGPSAVAAPSATGAPDVDINVLAKKVDHLSALLGGIKLGGDLRLRFDSTTRSANAVAGAAQNVRERYRFRLSAEKTFYAKDDSPFVILHATLATGPINNALTMDNDFAASAQRGFISLWEAWGQMNLGKHVSFRAGRVNEPFEDGSQFLIDPDLRFDGANETFHFGKKNAFFDFKAGQFVLSNPNVQVLTASNAYATAGFPVGKKVPATAMFDQGFVVGGGTKDWSQNLAVGIQLYTNPNTIALYSTSAGTSLINGVTGITLSGPLSGTGSATTTAGGPIFNAKDYTIFHLDYKTTFSKPKLGSQAFPVSLEGHFAHNMGTGLEANAWAGGIKLGQTKKLGEIAVGYMYFHKEANSLVSEYTDDDLGTVGGTNVGAHQFIFDVGLTKFMVWQNRVYVMDPLVNSNPAINFFVPFQAGMNNTLRVQSQFLFTF